MQEFWAWVMDGGQHLTVVLPHVQDILIGQAKFEGPHKVKYSLPGMPLDVACLHVNCHCISNCN